MHIDRDRGKNVSISEKNRLLEGIASNLVRLLISHVNS